MDTTNIFANIIDANWKLEDQKSNCVTNAITNGAYNIQNVA